MKDKETQEEYACIHIALFFMYKFYKTEVKTFPR